MANCPIHNRPMLCPACLGAKGGAKKSPRKTRAVRRNARKGGRPGVSSGWIDVRDFQSITHIKQPTPSCFA